jgi:hypothetical protein
MNDEILIAQQARKIAEIEEILASYHNAREKIRMIIYCIGGPLNDNKLQYTKQQMVDFGRIINELDF